MSAQLTTQDFWQGTLCTGVLSVFLVIPLIFVFKNFDFKNAAISTGLASAFFWGTLSILVMFGFWEIYYHFIYPGWIRWLAPLDLVLYAAIGMGMWWLATRLPGPAVLWFVLLGGLESIAEHMIGIYFLGILKKVPLLQGVKPAPALVFAFFEYMVYWAVVAWMSVALFKLIYWLRKP